MAKADWNQAGKADLPIIGVDGGGFKIKREMKLVLGHELRFDIHFNIIMTLIKINYFFLYHFHIYKTIYIKISFIIEVNKKKEN